jgi:hypothetical protein
MSMIPATGSRRNLQEKPIFPDRSRRIQAGLRRNRPGIIPGMWTQCSHRKLPYRETDLFHNFPANGMQQDYRNIRLETFWNIRVFRQEFTGNCMVSVQKLTRCQSYSGTHFKVSFLEINLIH